MKIEIEYKEVEFLKNKISLLEKQNAELQFKIDSLSEEQLIQKSIKYSGLLFNKLNRKVFKELGFEDCNQVVNADFEELRHWLGENFIDSERIEVEFGATVTNLYRQAFINIGINNNKTK